MSGLEDRGRPAPGAMASESGRGAWRRVTLLGPTRRLDITMPADVPSADLLPTLLGLVVPDPDPRDVPHAWELAPLGRDPIGDRMSLRDAGVRDGDLLRLDRCVPRAFAGSEVPPLRTVVEHVQDARSRWTAATTAFAVAVTAAVCAILLAILLGGHDPAPLPASAAIAAVALTTAGIAVAATDERAALISLSAASVCAALSAGAFLTVHATVAVPWSGCGALAAAAAPMLCAAPLVPGSRALLVGALTLLLASTAAAATVAAGVPALGVARVVAVAAVCAVGGVPRATVALTGLVGLDGSEDTRTPPHLARRATERVHRMATGLFLGVAAVFAASATVLALSDSAWDPALVATAALALAGRCRVPTRTAHVAALAIGSAFGVSLALIAAAVRVPWIAAALLPAVAVACCVIVTFAAHSRRWSIATRARAARSAALADRGLAALGVLVAAGAFGLYARIADVAAALAG